MWLGAAEQIGAKTGTTPRHICFSHKPQSGRGLLFRRHPGPCPKWELPSVIPCQTLTLRYPAWLWGSNLGHSHSQEHSGQHTGHQQPRNGGDIHVDTVLAHCNKEKNTEQAANTCQPLPWDLPLQTTGLTGAEVASERMQSTTPKGCW